MSKLHPASLLGPPYHYPHQLELNLRASGLRLEALYGDYEQAPFEESSERLLVIASPAHDAAA